MKGFIQFIPLGLMAPVLLAILFILVIGPGILISVSPTLMLIFQVAAAVTIYSWVKNTVGPGMVAYAIAGVLIYIFVITLPQVTAGIWASMLVMGYGLWTVLFWGLTMFGKK